MKTFLDRLHYLAELAKVVEYPADNLLVNFRNARRYNGGLHLHGPPRSNYDRVITVAENANHRGVLSLGSRHVVGEPEHILLLWPKATGAGQRLSFKNEEILGCTLSAEISNALDNIMTLFRNYLWPKRGRFPRRIRAKLEKAGLTRGD